MTSSALVTRLTVAVVAVLAITLALCAHAEVLNVISDIHYDPAYGTANGYKCTTSAAAALGQQNCDSPLALMKSVFADMSTRRNAYTLYAGDWQRHKFSASGLTASQLWPDEASGFASVTTSGTLNTSGQASVVGCLGNNDVVPDYTFDWSSTNQPDLEERVNLLFDSTILTSAEATEMRKCGYYSRTVSSTLRVVSLHSLLWANTLSPTVPDTVSDPCSQFSFLETELAAAKSAGQKVIILTHFPPTINFYDVIKNGTFTSAVDDMYWKPRFQERYYALLTQYADTVKLQLFGHTHMFTPVAHTASAVPGIIIPAISPVFGNIPSYLETTFDSNWAVENMQQRYLVNSAWTSGMQVVGALGLPFGFTNLTSLHASVLDMLTNDAAWDNYLVLHSGGQATTATFPNNQCSTFCRAVTVCSMAYAYYDDIKSCVTSATTTPTVDPQLNGSIVTSVLILGVCFAVAAILVLSKVIPKIRSGELACDKIHFDWRAQLLGATPKSEKKRRQEQQEEINRHNAAAQNADGATADDLTAAVEVVDMSYSDPERASRIGRE